MKANYKIKWRITSKKNNCVFCSIPENRVIKRFENFFVIEDAFPVTEMHTLIISNRHISSYFDLSHRRASRNPVILDESKETLKTECFNNWFQYWN